jgi:peptidoglycan/LPS O-acetylase OafA/YrhL
VGGILNVTMLQNHRRTSQRTKPPRKSSSFRRDIQGLRAIAVVAVILDHLLGWPSGGFVGVDVFFVISGFLITGLLLREHDSTGTISFVGFYRSRFKRIAPAATLVLAFTIGASWLIFNSARFISTVWDAVWGFLFVANWRFASVGTDYFQSSGPISPLQHYWSLAVEEQFYFVWPWLLLLIFALMGKRKSVRGFESRRVAGVVMAIITVASFSWALWETANNPTWSYFSTFSRTWELGIGALLAVFAGAAARLPDRIRGPLGWVGLLAIAASFFLVDESAAFPAPWAALPVLATALVIFAGTGTPNRQLWPLTIRPMSYIGDISYSLYLWHFPVIVLGAAIVGDGVWQKFVIAAISFLAAVYTYHLIEDPIRKSRWLKKGPRVPKSRIDREPKSARGSLMSLSLLAIVSAVLVAVAVVPPRVSSIVTLPPASASQEGSALAEAAEAETPALTALETQIQAALTAQEWPTLNPSFDEMLAKNSQAPADVSSCGLNPVDESKCTWGDTDASHTALIVGNSVSMTYVEALRSAFGEGSGWEIISYGKFACQFMDRTLVPAETFTSMPEGCATRSDEALEAINRINPDIVFVSGLGTIADGPAITSSQLDKITTESRIVFLPGPPIDKSVASCYTKLSSPVDCVSTTESRWNPAERQLANQRGDYYLDSRQWFCFDNLCPSFVGDTPTKLDTIHMTPEYAMRIGPAVWESLREEGLVGDPAL